MYFCLQMFNLLLPPGVNPIAVTSYIIISTLGWGPTSFVHWNTELLRWRC